MIRFPFDDGHRESGRNIVDESKCRIGNGPDSCAKWPRRKFLKNIAGSAIALTTWVTAAESVPSSGTGTLGDRWSLNSWGMAIDVEKCIGCGHCVSACKMENKIPNQPHLFRTWVERYRDYGDGEVIVDSPNGGYDGFPLPIDSRAPNKAYFVPKLCNACRRPPCVQVCPVGATFQTPDGAVLVDPKYCIGCRYCIVACPYGARFIHPVSQTADKCTFCYHRIQRGLKPACVENCPTGARIFGNLKDRDDPVSVFIRERKIFVLKQHLNTYPAVYYSGIDMEVR